MVGKFALRRCPPSAPGAAEFAHLRSYDRPARAPYPHRKKNRSETPEVDPSSAPLRARQGGGARDELQPIHDAILRLVVADGELPARLQHDGDDFLRLDLVLQIGRAHV